ncbi:MAG: Holliday junction branch migration protein RuvA [Anaerolineae bacterium]|nr:Holliday junction branch migration protein RuvA [Anaerolineae bacterium]
MIASLRGQVQALRENELVLRVGDVGYAVHVPRSLLDGRTRVGQVMELWTYTYVRENEIALYGFEVLDERDLFVTLLGVTGIGARTALAILSTFAPETLRTAIAQGNIDALTRIPGIGRKTAQRLLLDLKDKIGITAEVWPAASREIDLDVINALTALGYSVSEAQAALGVVPKEIESLDERILAALRAMGSG